jgi:hypothetical protein
MVLDFLFLSSFYTLTAARRKAGRHDEVSELFVFWATIEHSVVSTNRQCGNQRTARQRWDEGEDCASSEYSREDQA